MIKFSLILFKSKFNVCQCKINSKKEKLCPRKIITKSGIVSWISNR